MTDSDLDKAFDEFLQGKDPLNKDMTSMQTRDSVPSALDELILNESAKAQQTNTVTLFQQWQYPLSVAASLVLTVGIFLHYTNNEHGPYVVEREESISQTAPATELESLSDSHVATKISVDTLSEPTVAVTPEGALLEKQAGAREASSYRAQSQALNSLTSVEDDIDGNRNVPATPAAITTYDIANDISGLSDSDNDTRHVEDESLAKMNISPDSPAQAADFATSDLNAIAAEIEELKATQSEFEEEIASLKKELLSNQTSSHLLQQKKLPVKRSNKSHITPTQLEERLHALSQSWRGGDKSRAMRELLLFHRDYSEFPETIYQTILPRDFYQQFIQLRDKEVMTVDGTL